MLQYHWKKKFGNGARPQCPWTFVPRERLGALVSLLIEINGNIIMGRPKSHRIVGCATASARSNTAGKTLPHFPVVYSSETNLRSDRAQPGREIVCRSR